MSALPEGLLIAYYGDDFTGSTDVMEVLAFAGLPTALFLDAPDAADLAEFPGLRAIGVAGTARSRSPAWMRDHLAPALRALDGFGAPVLHYKVCSTFDSSPSVGSIGCALEIGMSQTHRDWCAMLVAAPALRRHQAFGNLFAAVDGVAYRLDRHPTMSRHPVTPMAEADLRRHLAAQTDTPVGLIDLLALRAGQGAAALAAERAAGRRAALFDAVDADDMARVGEIVWRARGGGLFAVASSGLEYALVAHWRAAGLLPPESPPPSRVPVERLLVVSGSCSPATAAQLRWAAAHGFAGIRLDVARAADPATAPAEVARAVAAAQAALAEGRDVAVFSAEGPDDVAALAPDRIAAALADVAAELERRCALPRIVIAGGDTSGAAAARLGVRALEALAPLAPGAPLCRAHRRGRPAFEIVLKGGQCGAPAFFGQVKHGRMDL